MELFKKLKTIKFIPLHFTFWMVVWLFYIYFFGFNSENSDYVIWFSNILIPVTIVTTYFFIYFLIPRYLLVKRYWKFSVYSVYTAVVSAYFIAISMFVGLMYKNDLSTAEMPPLSKSLPFILISVYAVVVLVSAFKLLAYNFETLEKNKSLENQILETDLKMKDQELQYLKKQIHPHFLFNTLNTIYGLALKQSKDTPDVILKLSNLLDYILYQVNSSKVSLKDEILHIKEYTELEKIRFQYTLKVTFNYDKTCEDVEIAPMLFIPFVENAFKHGDLINGFLNIDIALKIINDKLLFSVENSSLIANDTSGEKGIGLSNIEKRLDLLYRNSYDLSITHKENKYLVTLELTGINKY